MVLLCPPYIVAEQVLDKAVEGGEAAIPRRDAVATGGFEVRKRRQYRIDTDVIQTKAGHGATVAVCEETEEQAQGVCIHSQRVGACAAHPIEMVPEVGLNKRQQSVAGVGHRRTNRRRNRRDAMPKSAVVP